MKNNNNKAINIFISLARIFVMFVYQIEFE